MTFRRSFFVLFIAALGLFLTGCDLTGSNSNGCSINGNGVVFANQGNFSDNNGSVGFYATALDVVTCPSIGDLNSIVQSISVQEDKLYVTANSAGRLDVFGLPNTSRTGELSGLVGPRYITFPDDETAFLTDQQPFSSSDPDSVRAINFDDSSPEITSSVAVSGTVEGITNTGDRVYAALGAFGINSTVAILNADDATLETEIDIGCASRFVLADDEDEVFALCNNATTGEAVVLDGTTEKTRISLPDSVETAGSFGQDAYYASDAEELYVVIAKEKVVRINTATNQKEATITPSGNGPIGAVGYDPVEKRLYIGRADQANPFTAQGTIFIHDRAGNQLGSFKGGIAPDYIDFRRVDE